MGTVRKFAENDIFAQYRTIMVEEIKIRPDHKEKISGHPCEGCGEVSKCPEEICSILWRIFEVAKSSTVSRSYNIPYNLTNEEFMYESVGAHTNLVVAIATEALDFYFPGGVGKTPDGYTYREIIEAARLHDLPENVTGDLPDNGARDEEEKRYREFIYLRGYLDTYPGHIKSVKDNTMKLLDSMEFQTSFTGKMLYLSDKVAALIITLCLDFMGRSPMILEDSDYASKRDRQEMAMCDYSYNHAYRASEMWAADFFVTRKLVKFDENFFFTAIIVMATLAVNGKWYSWREKMYLK